MSGKFFLDTNILVYAHDVSDPDKRNRSRELVFEAIRTGDGVMSPQVLSEFFVTVTRKIEVPIPEEQARKVILLLRPICSVDLDATLVVKAVDVRKRWKVNYWDAMILAAAERGECAIVYSEDLSHEQHYGGVQVINPYAG